MRWLVEVVSLGKSERESLHVEAESWQKALQKARGQRGEASPLAGFSIELLDDGCRAVDPASRLRYEVRRAADAATSVAPPSVAPRTAVEASPPHTHAAPRPSSDVPRPRESAPSPPVATPPVAAPREEASAAAPEAPGATEPAPVSSAPAASEPYAASPSAPPPPMPPPSAPVSVPAPSPTRSTAPLPRSDGASDSSRPAASSSIYPPPQAPSASPSSPPPPSSPRAESSSRVPSQIIFKREHEATETTPLTYREYVFLVALGTSEEAAEALLTTQLELVLASLARVPPGKLVNLGVFDVAFQGKPTVLPLATLTWKDWRGTPVVEFPRRPGFRPRASSPMPPAAPPPAPSAVAPPAPAPPTQRPAITLSIPPPPPDHAPPPVATPVAPSVPAPAPPPVAAAPPDEVAPVPSPAAAARPAAPAPASQAAPPAIPEEAPAATAVLPTAPAAAPSPPPATSAPAPDVPAVPQAPPAPPPAAEPAPAPPPPSTPSRSPGQPRTRGEDLITALFESMHDLHFLRDAVEGGDFCLNLAMEKMPSQAGMVHLYDINRREFLVTSTRGASAGALLLRRHAETDAMLSVAMVRRRAVVVAAASETGALSTERYAAIGGARSLIIAPVMQAGRFLGAIELLNPLDGQPFTEAEGDALNYIAEQFAEFVAARGVVTDPARIGSTSG